MRHDTRVVSSAGHATSCRQCRAALGLRHGGRPPTQAALEQGPLGPWAYERPLHSPSSPGRTGWLAPRACAPTLANNPKFRQGKVSPPFLNTEFSHKIVLPQNSLAHVCRKMALHNHLPRYRNLLVISGAFAPGEVHWPCSTGGIGGGGEQRVLWRRGREVRQGSSWLRRWGWSIPVVDEECRRGEGAELSLVGVVCAAQAPACAMDTHRGTRK